ncbi:hypothetical protein BS50DRAFT_33697 [Corynespora cassiicola Philippines]|uniref:Uncharacterized protein n=1 Tax=Corynespora cassiicola Philippines TaxID=1448308 RepID=A0A2T2PBU3_CORCC|nr:hypothetical protein BS50DRAFT_33697 [Corynespora cassiicola Philippines]
MTMRPPSPSTTASGLLHRQTRPPGRCRVEYRGCGPPSPRSGQWHAGLSGSRVPGQRCAASLMMGGCGAVVARSGGCRRSRSRGMGDRKKRKGEGGAHRSHGEDAASGRKKGKVEGGCSRDTVCSRWFRAPRG